MIKAIILDDGTNFRNVIVKFGKNNYQQVTLNYLVNALCIKHNSDYQVRTAGLECLESEEDASLFEILTTRFLSGKKVIHECVEFEKLWESEELINGINVY